MYVLKKGPKQEFFYINFLFVENLQYLQDTTKYPSFKVKSKIKN